jgi:uncharacterized membrane protein
MQSRARFLGHPIHQMLIVFPLGLLATAVMFDIVALVRGNPFFFHMAYWMIAAGILGGLVSAIFGTIDWLAIPSGTRANIVGLWHGSGNLVVILLFAASWFLRRPVPTDPGTGALICSFAGAGLSLITGWLGGELVDRLAIGVDPGAHLNSPNSLSGRPANENAASPKLKRVA